VKFALVSHVLPPSESGQAMVLYRLLKDFDPATYCLISHDQYDGSAPYASYSSKLAGKYHRVTARKLNLPAAIVERGRNIARILRAERCGAVVACTGDLLNLPAAFVASRIAHVPYYIFMCDHYVYQWVNWTDRIVARLAAPWLLRSAAGTIVSNEFMADALKAAYAVDPVIIRNPCEPSDYADASDSRVAPSGDATARRIVFTGAIYAANYDAFRNLVSALARPRERRIELHVYSAQCVPESILQLAPDLVIHHPHASLAGMPAIQESADILFLPLAFNSPYPQVIKTASTAKLAEYLAAGRPILAHAPADSFVSWYVRKERCGIVVDEPSPARLADEITRLLADAELGAALGSRARSLAVSEFLAAKAQAEFAALLGLN